jgi:hypothetical protein
MNQSQSNKIINNRSQYKAMSATRQSQHMTSVLSHTGPFSQAKQSGLLYMPTLKNLTSSQVAQKNPMKIAMESASTFVMSCDSKYSVPTFSKLQLAKR